MRYKFLRFPGGKFKAVTFSYDDGFKLDTRLLEIFDKYNLKATFNLNGDYIRNPGDQYLSLDEVKKYLINSRHEIAVHGDKHRLAGVCTPIELTQDLLNCKIYLEEISGKITRGMAYANTGVEYFENGMTYEDTKNVLKYCGIAYSRTIKTDSDYNIPEDWYKWNPNISDGSYGAKPDENGVLPFIKKVDDFLALNEEKCKCAWANPRIFTVYGHSLLIDMWGHWEKFEMLCERLANRDDVWYATCIEIYDYVMAYRSLVFSADGRICYNPTLHKIWFVVDEKPYCIESGETITLD